MSGNRTDCPYCGTITPCNKVNMRLSGPDGGFVGNETI